MENDKGARAKKPSLDQVRSTADMVVRRAVADPAFRQQLKSDPQAVLQAAGIPSDALEDLAREIQIDTVATSRAPCSRTCFYSCIWSCFVTGA